MITLETSELLRALELGGAAASKRATIPVLECARLSYAATAPALTVYSANLDTVCQAVAVVATEGEPFDVCLPDPKSVRRALAAVGGPETSLAVDDHAIRISSGPLDIALDYLPSTDFPPLWELEHDCFSVECGAELGAALVRAKAAMSREATRYYLNGIHIAGPSSRLPGFKVVAVDGHRMHLIPIDFSEARGGLPRNLIIHRGAIEIMAERLAQAKAGIRLSVWKSGAFASFTSTIDGMPWSVQTRTVDGAFPNFETVIPPSPNFSFMADAAGLRRAVEALSRPVKEDGLVSLRFDVREDGTLCMSSPWNNPTFGSASISVPIAGLCGKASIFGFNARYLLDMLTAFEGPSVEFRVTDAVSPVLIRDPDNPGPFVILMPLRV